MIESLQESDKAYAEKFLETSANKPWYLIFFVLRSYSSEKIKMTIFKPTFYKGIKANRHNSTVTFYRKKHIFVKNHYF
jgi:hypothetical protein